MYSDTGVSVLLLALPLGWVAHWHVETWGHNATFACKCHFPSTRITRVVTSHAVCFVAMIPLQKIFDWGGEQMGEFLEEDLKDLLIITLSKQVLLFQRAISVLTVRQCSRSNTRNHIVAKVRVSMVSSPHRSFVTSHWCRLRLLQSTLVGMCSLFNFTAACY